MMTTVNINVTLPFSIITVTQQSEKENENMLEIELAPEIADRKSVTNWENREIALETWNCLFEAARRAPSSWNNQPARYIAVTEKEDILKLCSALHRANGWAGKAAGLLVQVAAPEDDDRVDGKDYYLYDCGLAMMSLIYQAQVLGITTRQMIGWDEAEVKSILMIPGRYRVVIVAGLGYPSDSLFSKQMVELKRHLTHQHKRFDMKHLVFWQNWGKGE
jgi:nitroreductase